jgi:hypothetical protein
VTSSLRATVTPTISRTFASAILITMTLMLTTAASARAQAGSISTIAPASASYGESVTITGIGFGGPNVVISVGGVPAHVVSATGTRATFLVPTGVPVGPTTVTATNPGGHTGSIPFNLSGLVTLTLDEPHMVQSVVGTAGGVLVSQSNGRTYTLTIPPGALAEDEAIVLTPVLKIAGLPLDRLLGAAHFAPEGLQFFKPATLAIGLPSDANTHGLVGFAAMGNGASLHLVPPAVVGGTIHITVPHFSVAGIGTAALPTLNVVTCGAAETLECIYTNQLGRAFAQAEQIVCGTDCSTDDDLAAHIDAIVDTWFPTELPILNEWFGKVLDLLHTTAAADDAGLVSAGHEYENWKAWVAAEPCGPSDCSKISDLKEDTSLGDQALASAYVAALQRAKAACNDRRVADLIVEVTQLELLGEGEAGSVVPESRAAISNQFGCQMVITAALPTFHIGDTVPFNVTIGIRTEGPAGSIAPLANGNVTLTITDGCGLIDGIYGFGRAKSGLTDQSGLLNSQLQMTGSCTGASNATEITVAVPDVIDALGGLVALERRVPFRTGDLRIAVSPENASVASGGTVVYSAQVQHGSALVTWTATGGTITPGPSATATYTAGTTPGLFSVTATSTDDPTQSQTVAVTVLPPPFGVTRVNSVATFRYSATSFDLPGDCGDVVTSPAGSSAWINSGSCTESMENELGSETATGSGDVSFAETSAGGLLTAISAEASGSATASATLAQLNFTGQAGANGGGSYDLDFVISAPTTMSIVGTITGGPTGFGSGGVTLACTINGRGIGVVNIFHPGTIDQTVQLSSRTTGSSCHLTVTGGAAADPTIGSASGTVTLAIAFRAS